MPIPEPKKGEEKNEFISRCIEFVKGEGTDDDQAVAICYDKWKKSD